MTCMYWLVVLFPKNCLDIYKDKSINPDIKPSETKVKASGELLNWLHLLVAKFGLANRFYFLFLFYMHAAWVQSRFRGRNLSDVCRSVLGVNLKVVWGGGGIGWQGGISESAQRTNEWDEKLNKEIFLRKMSS